MKPMTYELHNEFQAMRVYHPAYNRAWKMLNRLFQSAGKLDDPGCMAIYGPPGTGKSTLQKDFLALHPPSYIDNEMGRQYCVPVASFSTPTGCTPRDFSDVVCTTLRADPGSTLLTGHLQRKALTAIKCAGTKIVMPDEAQVFLRETSPVKSRKTLDFMREFYEESNIPLVFAGTQEYLAFIDSDEPLSRRVKYRAPLPPMGAPSSEKTAFHLTVQRMVSNYAEVTGRQLHKDVNPLAFSQRMYLASGGRIDSISDLFRELSEQRIADESMEKTYSVSNFADAASMLKLPFKLESSDPAFETNARTLPKLIEKHAIPPGALRHEK